MPVTKFEILLVSINFFTFSEIVTLILKMSSLTQCLVGCHNNYDDKMAVTEYSLINIMRATNIFLYKGLGFLRAQMEAANW